MQAQNQPQETWIKILSKGVITIPKEFREQLGIEEGDVARAKIEGDNLVIQLRKVAQYAEYRTFSKSQIDEFIKEDQLPQPLATEVQKRWANKMK
jgi:AbrB family looped-hinge helix DNA binding protein